MCKKIHEKICMTNYKLSFKRKPNKSQKLLHNPRKGINGDYHYEGNEKPILKLYLTSDDQFINNARNADH